MTTLGHAGKIALLGDIFDPSNTTAGLSTFDAYLGISSNLPVYVALHSAFPSSTQSDNEVTWAGTTPYARVQIARTAGSDPAGPGLWTVDQVNYTARNSTAITFAQHTPSGPTPFRWVSIGTAATGAGKIIARSPTINAAKGWFTANCIDLAGDLVMVSLTDHAAYTLAESKEVAIMRLGNRALPSPLSASTAYWIKTGSVTVGANYVTFQLATGSASGTAVNFTETAHFRLAEVFPTSLTANTTVSFAPLAMTFTAA